MHGQQSEERQQQQQQQHMWSPPSQRSSPSNTSSGSAYKACSKGDRTLHIGDTALFQAGNAPPFIGILRKVSVEKEDQVKLSVNWLYRPADLKLAKGVVLEAAPNEIFYSFHKDDISAASLLHPCKIAFLQKGVELPSGVSSFVCRRVYDTASKCLWWLTDRDYTDEHQQEVDRLLERTKLEMQAASQSGGPSPRALTGPIASPQLKVSVENVQNALFSSPGKGKKRERADQNSDPSKTEHNVKFDDPDTGTLKRERSMKHDKIATILDKDGGLLNVGVVEHLVQLMRNDLQDGGRKVADVVAYRTMLAGVIAATENSECLNWFVHLGGLCVLDEWLQEAHKGKIGDVGSTKECDKVVEDLLLALLRALDRLPVDLKALKTCSVGKSVNHLRSHKNVDIQKKARKLVDVWKKRVDAEMNSGESKPGSGHGISWSYKQSPIELGHPLTKIGSGGVPEVAVKSSGAFAGNAKVAVNGANSAAEVVKPLSVPPVSSKTASVESPDLLALKDSNSSKLAALNISPDMTTNSVKEEKSSSSSHTPSNGHSWGSAAGKGGSNIIWKEDVKVSGAFSVNGSSKTSSSGSPRLPNNKDLSGAGVSVGLKEAGAGKPMVWSRSASTEKAVASPALPETSSSAQKLIVRIPNPRKSPAHTSGGTADVTAPTSRSSSPSVLERHSSTGLADVLETKNMHQAESQAAFSPEAAADIKVGNGGKSGTGSSEDKSRPLSTVAPVNALECEKKTSIESAHEKVGVKEEADSVSKETLTSGCSSAFRGADEASPQVGDGGKDANAASAADSVEDRPPRHSQASRMEVDDGAMSLLASAAAEVGGTGSGTGTIERASTGGEALKGEEEKNGNTLVDARLSSVNDCFSRYMAAEIGEAPQSKDQSEAGVTHSALNHEIPSTKGSRGGGKIEPKEQQDGGSAERQGSVSPSDANRETESLSVEQGGGGERGEKKSIIQEGAGQACEASSNTPSTLLSMAEPAVENRRAIEASAKTSVEHRFLKEFNSSAMMNDVESKVSGKFGKRDFVSDERKSPRTQSKDSSARDMYNGIGIGGRDYRAHIGSFMESRTQQEKNGKRRGQEIGQLFGRRGDNDAKRITELVSGFPEEDVLEVARQAANEIEQMQENSKPVSSSSSERDGQNRQKTGSPTGGEMKDVTTTDTASREQHQVSPTGTDDRVKSSSLAKDQHHVTRVLAAHVNGMEKFDRVEEAVAKVVQAACSVDGEEVDQAMKVERALEWKSPASRGEEMNTGLEGGRGEVRRVDSPQPVRSLSFQSTQAEGVSAPVLESSTVSQPVGNSAATNNSEGDSTTLQQPVKGAGYGGDAAVGGSDASRRPDFDLNEGFAADDSPQDDPMTMPHISAALQVVQSVQPIASAASASGVAAPIAVLAATKGAFIPPASPMWIKGELGWKGSAATSAFRPAEPRRTPDRQHSSAESLASDVALSLNANTVKQARPLLEFDLNVADERVMEDIGVAGTTLSSQGSVLDMSSQNQSLPSSAVSGVTFNKQESPFLTFLKPESSSSANPLLNGGFGSLRASPGQAPSSSCYGAMRPNLDLDLNRMDDSEECGMPFSSDARAAEGAGSVAPSNNGTSKPARRVMDFDLNDGPSFEEVGVDEPPLQSLPARKPAGNAPMPMPMSGLRMGGEAMNFSPWFNPTGNPFAGVSIPAFAPGRVPDPGYSVPADAAAGNSFLNVGSAAATAMSPFNREIFRGGPTFSASPAVVYPPGERVAFGAYNPFPVFGGSTGYLPSSVPFSASFTDVSGPVPFPSQLGGQPGINSSTYRRPPLLMGMTTEAVAASDNSGGAWSRRSLDLNAGPELADTDINRDDMMHGRLPPLHPGNSAVFNDQMRAKLAKVSGNTGLTIPLKRKEPEGGWNCYTGSGGYKQSTWR